MMILIRRLLSGLFALIVGLVVLALLFSDLGPGETLFGRMATVALLLFFSGLAIGYVNPQVWVLSGLAAWPVALLGIAAAIDGQGQLQNFGFLVLFLGVAFWGGYLGAFLNKLVRRRRKQ